MERSESTDNLYKALDVFHSRTPLVKADKVNPFLKNKYADYNMVVSSTRGDLSEAGLRIKQTLTQVDGKTAVRTRLTHLDSSEFIEDVSPVESKAGDPQSQGSGITYMKRYSYVAMLDLLIDADDDGSLASGLGKVAEKNEAIDRAIDSFEKSKNLESLRLAFVGSKELMKEKKVIAAKDKRKLELEAEKAQEESK